jgi:hypothetical protein
MAYKEQYVRSSAPTSGDPNFSSDPKLAPKSSPPSIPVTPSPSVVPSAASAVRHPLNLTSLAAPQSSQSYIRLGRVDAWLLALKKDHPAKFELFALGVALAAAIPVTLAYLVLMLGLRLILELILKLLMR